MQQGYEDGNATKEPGCPGSFCTKNVNRDSGPVPPPLLNMPCNGQIYR
jgi:hypothetical protein